MTTLRFFVEYHWGKRQPELEFWLNDQQLGVDLQWSQQVSPYQTNQIHVAHTVLQPDNCLEIWQRDKTDADLLFEHDQIIDHWAKIQEIEIDGIVCQTALYRCTEFEHAMSDHWVTQMAHRGHHIQKTYRPGGTDIRLNGCCRLRFTDPVWQWYVTNYDDEQADRAVF